MTYIFWQNILSLHQSAFLRNLAENHHLILVVETDITEERIKDGWFIPDFGKAEIIIAPSREQINLLLERKKAVHIFSGIRAYKMPSEVFKLAAKKKLMIGVFSEPFNWMGLKGKLRFLKYILLRVRYNKYIHFILTTGERGRWCFETVGFKKAIIYDWAYFTETPNIIIKGTKKNTSKILFVGRIDKNKNILSLVSVCKKLKIIDRLQIVGKGPLERELIHTIKNTKCEYLGLVPNKQLAKIIENADVLVLPSLYDGWGLVINEALMCGIPVIASENCGASVLLKGIRGSVFSIKKNNLNEVLQRFITRAYYESNSEVRKEIRNWALQNISGEVAAKYFNEIITHLLYKSSQKPKAPWLK